MGAALSGNDKIAVTAERNNIVVWNAQNGQSWAFWQAPDQVLAISLLRMAAAP